MGFEVDVGRRTRRALGEGSTRWTKSGSKARRLIDEYARKGEPTPRLVRLRAPHASGQVQGWSGKHYGVRDHRVEVEFGDAVPLLRARFKKEGEEHGG